MTQPNDQRRWPRRRLPWAAFLVLAAACDGGGSASPASDTKVEIDASSGRLTLDLPSPAPGVAVHVEGAVPRVLVGGTWITATDYPERTTSTRLLTGGEVETSLTLSGLSNAPDLTLSIQPSLDSRGVVASMRASNTSGQPLTLEGFELSILPGNGGWVRVGSDPTACKMWIQGQNSWSFAGAVEVIPGPTGADAQGRLVPDSELFQIGNNTLTDLSGIELLLRGRDGIPLSWWNAVIEAPGAHGALLAGALTARRFKTSVLAGFDPAFASTLPTEDQDTFTTLRLVSGATGDRFPLAPGAEVSSEEWVLASYASGLEALAGHAALAGSRMEVLPRSASAPKLRIGWSSWSGYFEDISETSLLAEATRISERLAPHGYQVVQLDDGYEIAWGDWRTNEKFPSGIDGVGRRILELGLVPGIWIAPFLADDDLPVVAEHPAWFLTGYDGEPVRYATFVGDKTRRAIDVTNPEAAAFVRANLERIRDAGMGLVKADFLFGAGYEGRHFDPNATGLDAYHRGMWLIRDTLGPDVTIIGIAGPWLATAGTVDYYRQSNDVALAFPGAAWPFFQSEALGTTARSHSHEIFFRSDPDHVLVGKPLSVDEARVVASYVALSGGLWFVGDAVTGLSDERLAIVTNPDILAIVSEGRAAVPIDLFEASSTKRDLAPIVPWIAELLGVDALAGVEVPSIWKLERPDGSIVLGIFNWSDQAAHRELQRSLLGLSNARLHFRDLWGGTEGELADPWVLEQPLHSVSLVLLNQSS